MPRMLLAAPAQAVDNWAWQLRLDVSAASRVRRSGRVGRVALGALMRVGRVASQDPHADGNVSRILGFQAISSGLGSRTKY